MRDWAAALKSYGYSDPEGLARTLLWLVDGVCLLGFVGAAIWLVIHFQKRQRWAAFPVLWLSGTMLLFQNITARFLLYPARPGYINMHYVFWILLILMIAYVAVARPKPVDDFEPMTEERKSPIRPLGWLAAAIAGLGIVIYLAGHVNNDKTMATANTRWPIWAWPNGPFPGRTAKP